MAFRLAAYVSRLGYPSPRKTRFQVLVRLSWVGFHPQGSDKRFQLTSCGLSSSSKLLGTIRLEISIIDFSVRRHEGTGVTSTEYNDRGEAWKTTDPAGHVTKTVCDDAGRVISTIQNFSGSGSYYSASPDQNINTTIEYNEHGQFWKQTDRAGSGQDQGRIRVRP